MSILKTFLQKNYILSSRITPIILTLFIVELFFHFKSFTLEAFAGVFVWKLIQHATIFIEQLFNLKNKKS